MSWRFTAFQYQRHVNNGLIRVAIALVSLLVTLWLIRKICEKEIYFVAKKLKGKKLFKVLDSSSLIQLNNVLIKFIRFLVNITILTVFLNIVLSFFPWTYNLAARLYEIISKPVIDMYESFVATIPDLLVLAVIITLMRYIIKFVKMLFDQIKDGDVRIEGFYPEWADQTYRLVRLILIIAGGVAAFPYIPGSDSPAFKGISLFMGVLFSLGSTSAVGNIVAGLVITYMRPFKTGDFVQVSDTMGVVVDCRTFSLRIKTPKNVIVTIPNTEVTANHIVNLSRRSRKEGVILHTSITIGYDVHWRQVRDLLLKAASLTDNLLDTPEPFVLQKGLQDFYVEYELNVSTKFPHLSPRIYSQLHQNIQDQFSEADVEIMSPHYRHNRDGNETTIPSFKLMQDEEA